MNVCPFCSAPAAAESVSFACGSDTTSVGNMMVHNNRCNPNHDSSTQEEAPIHRTHQFTSAVFNQTAANLEPVIFIANDVAHLYQAARDEFDAYNRSTHASIDQAMIIQACLAAKREHLNGTVALLRGQTNDALGAARKATEFALFAAWAVEKDASAIWFAADHSDESWQTYRETFRIMSILNLKKWGKLQHLNDELNRLFQNYETCSKRVHATVISAGPAMVHEGEFNTHVIVKDVFAPIEPPLVMLQNFLFLMDCHLDVLDIIRKLFQSLAFEMSQHWDDYFRYVEKALNEHRPSDNHESIT